MSEEEVRVEVPGDRVPVGGDLIPGPLERYRIHVVPVPSIGESVSGDASALQMYLQSMHVQLQPDSIAL